MYMEMYKYENIGRKKSFSEDLVFTRSSENDFFFSQYFSSKHLTFLRECEFLNEMKK